MWNFIFKEGKLGFQIRPFELNYPLSIDCLSPWKGLHGVRERERDIKRVEQKMSKFDMSSDKKLMALKE